LWLPLWEKFFLDQLRLGKLFFDMQLVATSKLVGSVFGEGNRKTLKPEIKLKFSSQFMDGI